MLLPTVDDLLADLGGAHVFQYDGRLFLENRAGVCGGFAPVCLALTTGSSKLLPEGFAQNGGRHKVPERIAEKRRQV